MHLLPIVGVLELFDLSGQTAVVTGGGSGLGRDMALALAEAGANLVLPDVNGDLAEQAAERIRALAARCPRPRGGHCRSGLAVERCFAATMDRFGRRRHPDQQRRDRGVLGASEDATQAEWQRVFDVNVTGMFHCCQLAGRIDAGQGHGKIVNIASIYGLVGTDERLYVHRTPITHQGVAYNASKGAVISLTRALAVEWAARGIQVNAIAPGMMKHGSRSTRSGRTYLGQSGRTDTDAALGSGDDLRGAVVFLAAAASDFVTGHVLVVDGGWTAW